MTLASSGSRARDIGLESRLGRDIGAALAREGSVTTAAFDRVTAAPDASHYLLTPRAVVTPKNAAEVGALFTFAAASGEPLTFRSGGTSLSGQATTGGILVDTRMYFRKITVLDDGLAVKVQPGATVRQVNARLGRFGRKLGPDPASEIACTIGGVIANNSSGMACGITQNTYRTLESAVVVLASGTVVDTALPDADKRLRAAEPALVGTLERLRAEVLAAPELEAEIVRQYGIKNTMGYGLNSLLDHERPVDILLHLLVGSEGTLGFIAEATFRTVPLHPLAATALLTFETLTEATDALTALVATGAATIELLDAASLRVVQQDPASEGTLPDLVFDTHAALLVEYQADDEAELAGLTAAARHLFDSLATTVTPVLSGDPGIRAALWHLRKGLYAQIAGARPAGTTALLEDIAVPVAQLSEVCAGLIALFALHGYDDAVIFGHAKDGNIHFLINENFELESNLGRYRAFTDDMVDLVLAAGGTLKAEHGTGRIMAPYVRRQYGDVLYGMMLDIKRAFDPAGILNPDALLTSDADLHLKHLKSTPTIEVEADRCVECGYCEPVCPSKDLTLTPRQRIVVRRAIAEATAAGDTVLVAELERSQQYEVVDTCAVDGMCQTSCPVDINTGDLVRRLRKETVGAGETAVWATLGKAWKPVTEIAAVALDVTAALPAPLVTGPNRLIRRLLGNDTVPLWSSDLPAGGSRRRGDAGVTAPRGAAAASDRPAPGAVTGAATRAADAVYFQACIGTMFGPADGSPGVAVSLESLAAKAGLTLTRPANIASLCCGTPWKSKGMTDGYHAMIDQTVDALWEASGHGTLPVVCDNSSCSEGLVHALEAAVSRRPAAYQALRVVDAVDFAATRILPQLSVAPDARLERLVVHPTCSSTRAGSNDNLLTLSRAVARVAVVPDDWGCCAFAGDRGMLHPELTASATAREAAEVVAAAESAEPADAHASCNRTCEIGMTRATGHAYQHVLELLDAVAEPGGPGGLRST
nr:FAD-binding and (Fe-S)-binding domain-containing protein [Subtercola sp. Z020]